MGIVFNVVYAVYVVLMCVFAFKLFTSVMLACYFFHSMLSLLNLTVAISFSERRKHEWWLLQYAFVFPFYKGMLRWVRSCSVFIETFRLDYRDPYLPDSAYNNTERW